MWADFSWLGCHWLGKPFQNTQQTSLFAFVPISSTWMSVQRVRIWMVYYFLQDKQSGKWKNLSLNKHHRIAIKRNMGGKLKNRGGIYIGPLMVIVAKQCFKNIQDCCLKERVSENKRGSIDFTKYGNRRTLWGQVLSIAMLEAIDSCYMKTKTFGPTAACSRTTWAQR